jgi:hypothetical protein
VPALVLSETGGEPLIVLPLSAFRQIAGIGRVDADPQMAIDFPKLGTDEQRVLQLIAARLEMGAGTYGPLAVASDARDWRHEAAEELLDGCVYLACDVMRRKEG